MPWLHLKPWPKGSGGQDFTKPVMRGWIHTVAAPLALAASIVLLVLAPTPATKWACAVYLVCSLFLFGFSAFYHQFYWGPKARVLFRKIDHANIFLLIAGTYTPITVSLLEGSKRITLLSVVWVGAVIGGAARIAKVNMPRWFYTPIYVILGWVAIWYLKDFLATGGPAVVWLLIAGGICYTIGAVVYGFQWPDPSPKYFGYHEIFHAGTVAGWACHCVAAYLAVLNTPLLS